MSTIEGEREREIAMEREIERERERTYTFLYIERGAEIWKNPEVLAVCFDLIFVTLRSHSSSLHQQVQLVPKSFRGLKDSGWKPTAC